MIFPVEVLSIVEKHFASYKQNPNHHSQTRIKTIKQASAKGEHDKKQHLQINIM